ncbi:hypothetical protein GCM10007859_06860 [Brevundimonas denitrificans]|uniref:Uncharacterized protein n=1 Tax=Brevundimonas denitrificans TaxID=1443434 RepID=A0ABQ6BLD4_9CAUL|nr:hypothetical protein GCM10007859_06860 [Brevundimonas denitrificans]
MLGAIVGGAELLRDQQASLSVQLFLVGREKHALPQTRIRGSAPLIPVNIHAAQTNPAPSLWDSMG